MSLSQPTTMNAPAGAIDETARGKRIQHKDKRDVLNFMHIRTAGPGDDAAIGAFLLHTFLETYERKLPNIATSEERKRDLLDVRSKRRGGVVCLLELGFKIVGVFAMLHPDANSSEAWLPNSGNLRCVAVDPECHGLAFSQVILKESVEIALAWKLENICLHVQRGADSVARLYQNFGYLRDPSGDMVSKGQEIEAYYLPLKKLPIA